MKHATCNTLHVARETFRQAMLRLLWAAYNHKADQGDKGMVFKLRVRLINALH